MATERAKKIAYEIGRLLGFAIASGCVFAILFIAASLIFKGSVNWGW